MRASNTRNRKTTKNAKVDLRIAYFPSYARPLLRRAVLRTLAAEKDRLLSGISLILVSDGNIRRMNRAYRRVDRVTDVISFRVGTCGDIYISSGRSKKQARQVGHSWKRELAYLTVHGVLHVLGYSDYTPRNRARMFKVQDKIFHDLID